MIPLQECYETDFEDVRKDSKEPSTAEILEWSEQWAHQLRLWGDDLDHALPMPDTNSSAAVNTFSLLQQEQEIAELCNFNFRSVQNHPHKRKRANELVNDLLRDVGVSDDNIAGYGEALPYKIAQLHHTMSPRPLHQQIPVWLYKKDINADNFSSVCKDLHCFLIEARLSLEKLYQQLHQAANSTLPVHTEWEYSLLEGPHTKRSPTNSGRLRRLSDWHDVSRRILSPANPYHAVIVFQPHDMHRNYQPLPTLDECQEKGMFKLNQLIENAKYDMIEQYDSQDLSDTDTLCPSNNSFTSHVSSQTIQSDSRLVERKYTTMPVSRSKYQAMTQTTTTISGSPSQRTAQPVLQSFELRKTADIAMSQSTTFQNIKTRGKHDPLPTTDDQIALSRYLTVWLEQDDAVNNHVEYRQCSVPQSRHMNYKRNPRDTWYFQPGL